MDDTSNYHELHQESLIAQIVDEFTDRLNLGEQPEIEQYAREHPALAQELRELLTPLAAMHSPELKKDESPGSFPVSDTSLVGKTLGQYHIVREIGRGGMAVVYEATHRQLRRRVALKIIAAHLDGAAAVQRFEREARAAANLHHTHIVPVYEAGVVGERHYIAMQYISGVSLDEVLRGRSRQLQINKKGTADRNSASTCVFHPEADTDSCSTIPPTSEPTDLKLDSVASAETAEADAFRGEIDQYARIADAAYFRKVANLGVQASEALAYAHDRKVLHRDIKPSNLLLDENGQVWVTDFGLAKTEDESLSNPGDIIGTLRYMAPERFQGHCDPRSDAYGLGVTLYEMLTLHPAFGETDQLQLIKQVIETEPSQPRRLQPSLPRDLETIVLKATAKDPGDRYHSALDLADDLRHFLRDEPIRARPWSVWERAWRWCKRNRAAVLVTAVLFVAVMVAVGGFAGGIGWAVRDQQERQARTTGRIEVILDDVDRLMKDQRWPQALVLARRAQSVNESGDADAATETRLQQVLATLTFVEQLENARLRSSEWIDDQPDYDSADRAFTAAFRNRGIDIENLPPSEAASLLLDHNDIAVPVAVALDDWAGIKRFGLKEEDTRWKRLITIAGMLDPDSLRKQMRKVSYQKLTGENQKQFADLYRAKSLDDQPAVTLVILGANFGRAKLLKEAIYVLRLAQHKYPDDFWVNVSLADTLRMRDTGDPDVIRFYSAALALRPGNHAVLNNLGSCLGDGKRPNEAIRYYKQAIEKYPKLARAFCGLAKVYMSQKKWDQAIKNCQEAIGIDPKCAPAYYNLGIVFAAQEKWDQAIDCLKNAIASHPRLAGVHYNLGNVYRAQQKWDQAIQSYQSAIAGNRKDVSAHNNLGTVYFAQKKWDQAIQCYRTAIAIDPNLVSAHYNLAKVYQTQEKWANAIQCYQTVISIDPKDAQAHCNLGSVYVSQKKWNQAVQCFQSAINIDPNDVLAHRNLGGVYQALKKWDHAIKHYQKAIAVDPKHAFAHVNLGNVYLAQKNWEQAIQCYETALAMDPKLVHAHNNLGFLYMRKQELGKAVASYRRSLAASSNDFVALNNLAMLLADASDPKVRNPAQAIQLARKLIKLQPKLPHGWMILSIASYRAGDWKGALAANKQAMPTGQGPFHWLWRAMIHWKLNEKDEARHWFNKAAEFLKAKHSANADLMRLRKEAEELLGITKKGLGAYLHSTSPAKRSRLYFDRLANRSAS